MGIKTGTITEREVPITELSTAEQNEEVETTAEATTTESVPAPGAVPGTSRAWAPDARVD